MGDATAVDGEDASESETVVEVMVRRSSGCLAGGSAVEISGAAAMVEALGLVGTTWIGT